jgi:hypothetical protein
MFYTTNFFAQAYGVGNYDDSTYETTTTGTGSGGSTGTGSTGSTPTGTTTTTTTTAPTTAKAALTDTGFDIAVAVTLASVLLLLAMLVRFWRRPVGSSR